MSAPPFDIVNGFSAAIGLPEKFYLALFDVLIQYDGLHLALNSADTLKGIKVGMRAAHERRWGEDEQPKRVYGVDSLTAYFVLKDIIRGNPRINVMACQISEKTIYRTLQGLSDCDPPLLIRLRVHPTDKAVISPKTRRVITPVYGFNIPALLHVVNDCLPDKDDEDVVPTLQVWTRKQMFLVNACQIFIEPYKPVFRFLMKSTSPILFPDEFTKQLKALCPSRDTLLEGLGMVNLFEIAVKAAHKFKVRRRGLAEDGRMTEDGRMEG
jgi:hypothetical protein